MLLDKDVSIRIRVTNENEGLMAVFKTVGDKILLTADNVLYDPQELLAAITECIAFQNKLKLELTEAEHVNADAETI